MDAQETFIRELSKHRSSLFGYIFAITGDFHLAEDIFQEALVVAAKKADTFKKGTSFGAWIREIARLKLLEEKRRIARRALTLDPDILQRMGERYEAAGDRWVYEKEALKDCLEELPERLRTLVRLRYGKSLSLKIIAEKVKKTSDAVQMALSRIRKTLLSCIQRQMIGKNAI